MKKSYVYKITCLVTGEYYFGSSFNAKSDWYWGGGKRIRERIAQYGKENFVKEILEEFNDRVEAHRVENEYIENFRHDEKCLNERLEHKFGLYGEESRAKVSAAHSGKTLSEEHRAKIGDAERGEKNHNFGKHFSEEHRAKIGASQRGEKNHNFGKHLSDDTRTKLSAANRGEKNPMFGKHHTDDTRSKMSVAHLGILRGKHWRKNPVSGKREWYD